MKIEQIALTRSIFFLLLLFLPATLQATTMLDLNLTDKVKSALAKADESGESGAGIIRAKVKERWTEYNSQQKYPFTYTELVLKEQVAGEEAIPSDFLVRQLGGKIVGGELDGLEFKVHGQASFAKDEEVLLFLRREASGNFKTVGMSQGKYRIFTDPQSGMEIAATDFDGKTMFVSKGKSGVNSPVFHKEEEETPLNKLINEIKEIEKNLGTKN